MIVQRMKKLMSIVVPCVGMFLGNSLEANWDSSCCEPSCCNTGCGSAFDGFYAGVNLGYSTTISRFSLVLPGEGEFHRAHLGLSSVDGGFQLGWGKSWGLSCSNIYVGLDFRGVYTGSRGKHHYHNTASEDLRRHNQLRLEDSYQLAVRIGAPVCDCFMLYVKLGWNNASWRLNHHTGIGSDDSYSDFSSSSSSTSGRFAGRNHRRLNGFLAGVGADMLLSEHFILGLDWTYTQFDKQHTNIANDIDDISRSSHRPRYNRFAMTVSYLF